MRKLVAAFALLLFVTACDAKTDKTVEGEECDAHICVSLLDHTCSTSPDARSKASVTIRNNTPDGSDTTYSSSIVVDGGPPNKVANVTLVTGKPSTPNASPLKRATFTITSKGGKKFERSFVRNQQCGVTA